MRVHNYLLTCENGQQQAKTSERRKSGARQPLRMPIPQKSVKPIQCLGARLGTGNQERSCVYVTG